MSHPNPHHDRENERVEDSKFAPKKRHALGKSLEKAKGGMIGDLKRTIRDKDLKKDHYGEFKKQHNIK